MNYNTTNKFTIPLYYKFGCFSFLGLTMLFGYVVYVLCVAQNSVYSYIGYINLGIAVIAFLIFIFAFFYSFRAYIKIEDGKIIYFSGFLISEVIYFNEVITMPIINKNGAFQFTMKNGILKTLPLNIKNSKKAISLIISNYQKLKVDFNILPQK